MDGIARPQFQRDLFRELRTLQRELATRQYKPQPIRITTLKKADGSCYPIGILAVRDRVAQHAVLNVIEPLFKAGAVTSKSQRARYPGVAFGIRVSPGPGSFRKAYRDGGAGDM